MRSVCESLNGGAGWMSNLLRLKKILNIRPSSEPLAFTWKTHDYPFCEEFLQEMHNHLGIGFWDSNSSLSVKKYAACYKARQVYDPLAVPNEEENLLTNKVYVFDGPMSINKLRRAMNYCKSWRE